MNYRAVLVKPNSKVIILGRVEKWFGSKEVFFAKPLQAPAGHLLLTREGWPDICVDADDTFDVTETTEALDRR